MNPRHWWHQHPFLITWLTMGIFMLIVVSVQQRTIDQHQRDRNETRAQFAAVLTQVEDRPCRAAEAFADALIVISKPSSTPDELIQRQQQTLIFEHDLEARLSVPGNASLPAYQCDLHLIAVR